jgi:hypothetical protein
VNPKEVESQLLERYMKNDIELAKTVAFDKKLHLKNRVELDLASVEFDVIGESLNESESARIQINCPFGLGKRPDKVLSYKLQTSRELITTLYKTEYIRVPDSKKKSS